MSRLTWDEMKERRDGTLAPLTVEPGQTAEDKAYETALIVKRKRLFWRWSDAEEDAQEAQLKADRIWEEIQAVEAEMKELGILP